MTEKDMAARFVLYDEEELWLHRECSLDPDWNEPDWIRNQMLPFNEGLAIIQCRRCKRTLSEDPPHQWSKMDYAQVQDILKRRRDDQRQAVNEIAQLSQDLGMYE